MCTKIKQNDFIKIELNRNRAKTILLKCGKQKKILFQESEDDLGLKMQTQREINF